MGSYTVDIQLCLLVDTFHLYYNTLKAQHWPLCFERLSCCFGFHGSEASIVYKFYSSGNQKPQNFNITKLLLLLNSRKGPFTFYLLLINVCSNTNENVTKYSVKKRLINLTKLHRSTHLFLGLKNIPKS